MGCKGYCPRVISVLLARVPGPQVYTDYIIIFPRVQFGNVQLKRYVTEMSKCAHCTAALSPLCCTIRKRVHNPFDVGPILYKRNI